MARARATILADESIGRIRPELYGHFAEHLGACVNGGVWVGVDSPIPNIGGIRLDVVEALRKLRPGVLRWPGGCFADDYHWEDGIGPREKRPKRVNIWWGGDLEDNHFGTHEFIQLCRLIGAEPYLAGNLGSGSVREMRDWAEYCNGEIASDLAIRRGANGSPAPFRVKYWGVGNEAWGCGGNFCPEDYAAEYKRYQTFLKNFGSTELFLIACGPDGNNASWTRRFFNKIASIDRRFGGRIHGFAAHYYCGTAGTATQYSIDQWYELLERAALVEKLILDQRAIMDEFDPQRKIGLILDEWGTWHPPTEGRVASHLWQQNTMRDALVAGITLDALNRHCDKVVMANIAQVVNVLQAMILTEGDKMVVTPTYHVFEMYRQHQGAMGLRVEVDGPTCRFVAGNEKREIGAVSGSASVHEGKMFLSLVNRDAALPIDVELRIGKKDARADRGRVLAGEIAAHNTFDAPTAVTPAPADGNGAAAVTLPPASVSVWELA